MPYWTDFNETNSFSQQNLKYNTNGCMNQLFDE